MAKRKQQEETRTTNDVVAALESRGYHVYKIYNGGIPAGCRKGFVAYKKKEDKDKGVPDLIAINREKKDFMFIEMKSSKGKLSKVQKDFIESFNDCKEFNAIMCRSGEDIIKILRECV